MVVCAAALAVAAALVPGIHLADGSDASKTATLLLVAVIFGVINSVLKPIIKVIVGVVSWLLQLVFRKRPEPSAGSGRPQPDDGPAYAGYDPPHGDDGHSPHGY